MTEQRLGIGTKIRVDVPEARGFLNHPARMVASAVAVLLVGLWIAWWVASSRRNMLVQGHRTWVPLVQPFLACDFVMHIDPLRTPLCPRRQTSTSNPTTGTAPCSPTRRWSCERSAGWPGSQPGPPCEFG